MIPVTKTFFPDIKDYQFQLQRIWKNEWLTNRGELVIELESKLRSTLNLKNLILTTNGTLPIQIALNFLAKEGEVITTPFSYVATTSAIVWEKCKPIFVDIHPKYLTIDETKIEAAITDKTTAILATHVFGNPCNIDKIEEIANKYNLKVIYDAAHCFGVKFNEKSLLDYGDVSTCSFHATKIFHTGEGGAIICNNDNLYKELYHRHNFGHNGPENFHCEGINAKMSELQAAMGLSVLPNMDVIFKARKKIVEFYEKNLDSLRLSFMTLRKGTIWNYSYFPVIFESESKLLDVQIALNELNIFPRRYFYPSLNTIGYTGNSNMVISEDIASRILCLPLYFTLEESDLKLIVETINKTI